MLQVSQHKSGRAESRALGGGSGGSAVWVYISRCSAKAEQFQLRLWGQGDLPAGNSRPGNSLTSPSTHFRIRKGEGQGQHPPYRLGRIRDDGCRVAALC